MLWLVAVGGYISTPCVLNRLDLVASMIESHTIDQMGESCIQFVFIESSFSTPFFSGNKSRGVLLSIIDQFMTLLKFSTRICHFQWL
jgi:hypothetical protein